MHTISYQSDLNLINSEYNFEIYNGITKKMWQHVNPKPALLLLASYNALFHRKVCSKEQKKLTSPRIQNEHRKIYIIKVAQKKT